MEAVAATVSDASAVDFDNTSSNVWQAIYKDDVDLLLTLLKSSADPNLADESGMTPLAYCCRHGLYKLTTALLKSSKLQLQAEVDHSYDNVPAVLDNGYLARPYMAGSSGAAKLPETMAPALWQAIHYKHYNCFCLLIDDPRTDVNYRFNGRPVLFRDDLNRGYSYLDDSIYPSAITYALASQHHVGIYDPWHIPYERSYVVNDLGLIMRHYYNIPPIYFIIKTYRSDVVTGRALAGEKLAKMQAKAAEPTVTSVVSSKFKQMLSWLL